MLHTGRDCAACHALLRPTIYIVGRKKQINYNFIPTSLFRGCPLIP